MSRLLRTGAPALLAIATALATAGARAGEPARWDPTAQRNAAGSDLVWNSAKYWGSSFAIVPWLHYEIVSQVFADAYLPFTFNVGGPDLDDPFGGGSAAHAAFGNPTIGAHYASTDEKLTWFAGGRVSLPLAAFHGQGYQLADVLALAAYGAYDSWLWAPEYFPISGTAGLEYRAADPVYVRASIDPMLLISTTSSHTSIFATQLKLEGEGRSSFGLGGGLALLGVFQLTSAAGDPSPLNDDRAQLLLNPFASYDDGSMFGRFGLLLALDHPLGFGFDHASIFGPTTAAVQVMVGKHLK